MSEEQNKNEESSEDIAEETQTSEQVTEETVAEEKTSEPEVLEDVTLSGEDFAKLKEQATATKAEQDKYVRLYAEFENAKKMWDKQKVECLKYGAFNIIKEFATVLDDIEAATVTLDVEKHKEYAEGLDMVYSKIKDVLDRQGLKEIEAEGKAFDPHFHEALMFAEREDLDEHTVVNVIQKGYAYEDKVLRPARVQVSKKPAVASE